MTEMMRRKAEVTISCVAMDSLTEDMQARLPEGLAEISAKQFLQVI